MSPKPAEVPEGNCRTCGYYPHDNWRCLGLEAFWRRPNGTSHPGRCWKGAYPDDIEAQKREDDRETEKQRQAEERRPTQLRLL